MKTTRINPEILAQRLETAAAKYTAVANECPPANAKLAEILRRQAAECLEWAEAFRNSRVIGWEGDDIELDG